MLPLTTADNRTKTHTTRHGRQRRRLVFTIVVFVCFAFLIFHSQGETVSLKAGVDSLKSGVDWISQYKPFTGRNATWDGMYLSISLP